jgi:arylsulfatase A-like enzyme
MPVLRLANVLLVALSFSIFYCSQPSGENQLNTRPNLLLIIADDLGYADLGCYGGDIETPTIDALAARGLRFSRFHTAPLCAPTRAMLLSGNDNHIAGMGVQGLETSEFGYEGHLSDRIAAIPEVLRMAGYHTYMTGKWHLGLDSLNNPHQKGFERSFVNLSSSGNHYSSKGIWPQLQVTPYSEDGKAVDWPEGKYSTDYFTDKLIQFIGDNKDSGQPFFAYAAYTSPHWPLQVDEKYWKKYEGRYDEGYEKWKEKRLISLKKAGMVPEDAVLPSNHERVVPWDSLTKDQQKVEARKMELYAGMVDNLDVNVGRLINYLEEIGQLENTLIVFMSDNGAAAEDFYSRIPFLQENYSEAYEDMGTVDSYISYGPQWAEAGSSPFRYFKGQLTEGGNVAPMIIAGRGVERINDTFHGLVTVMDIAPTFYELAGTSYPDSYKNKKLFPMKGSSLKGLLSKTEIQVHTDDYVFGLEHAGRAMLRKGDWKILSNDRPFSRDSFKLYDLSNDLAELNDLREMEPEKYQELLNEWDQFAEEIRVQFPPPRRGE